MISSLLWGKCRVHSLPENACDQTIWRKGMRINSLARMSTATTGTTATNIVAGSARVRTRDQGYKATRIDGIACMLNYLSGYKKSPIYIALVEDFTHNGRSATVQLQALLTLHNIQKCSSFLFPRQQLSSWT